MNRVPSSELSPDSDCNDGVYYHRGEPFTGISFTTYSSGELKYESEWRHGVAWGFHRKYAPDGSLIEAGEFRAGFPEGVWRTWHPNGRLASEEEREFGALLKRRRWDADGNLVEEYRLQEGMPEFATLQVYRRLYGQSGYIEQRPSDGPDQP